MTSSRLWFSIFFLSFAPALLVADTITYSGYGTSYDAKNPLVAVYTEQIQTTYPFSPSGIPQIYESSIPCSLEAGCSLGSYSVPIPGVSLPTGQYLVSATLHILNTFGVIPEGGFTAVAPINPNEPYTASDYGTHDQDFILQFGTAAGNFGSYFLESGDSDNYSVDYTAQVLAALASGGTLAPIQVNQTFYYNAGDPLSIIGGFNSVTTYQSDFYASPQEGTTIDLILVTATPEPSCLPLAAGVLCAGFCLVRLKFASSETLTLLISTTRGPLSRHICFDCFLYESAKSGKMISRKSLIDR